MEKNLIEQFKKQLLLKKEELEKELESFAEKDSNKNWETRYPSNSGADLEEEADEVEEYENLLPVEHALENKLKDVILALEKIEIGTYGICENCDKEIPIERLKIFPEARICNDCK
jgi:DnaK suppressor protein